MLSHRLYLAQRLAALALAPFVLMHLVVMIIAIEGGLTAAEILSRTQGSAFWAAFYGGFVAVAALHASIGLRVIVHETLGLGGAALTGIMWGAGLLLAGLGMRAVWAVTTGGAP